jgi:uncharacterized protein with PIN domain
MKIMNDILKVMKSTQAIKSGCLSANEAYEEIEDDPEFDASVDDLLNKELYLSNLYLTEQKRVQLLEELQKQIPDHEVFGQHNQKSIQVYFPSEEVYFIIGFSDWVAEDIAYFAYDEEEQEFGADIEIKDVPNHIELDAAAPFRVYHFFENMFGNLVAKFIMQGSVEDVVARYNRYRKEVAGEDEDDDESSVNESFADFDEDNQDGVNRTLFYQKYNFHNLDDGVIYKDNQVFIVALNPQIIISNYLNRWSDNIIESIKNIKRQVNASSQPNLTVSVRQKEYKDLYDLGYDAEYENNIKPKAVEKLERMHGLTIIKRKYKFADIQLSNGAHYAYAIPVEVKVYETPEELDNIIAYLVEDEEPLPNKRLESFEDFADEHQDISDLALFYQKFNLDLRDTWNRRIEYGDDVYIVSHNPQLLISYLNRWSNDLINGIKRIKENVSNPQNKIRFKNFKDKYIYQFGYDVVYEEKIKPEAIAKIEKMEGLIIIKREVRFVDIIVDHETMAFILPTDIKVYDDPQEFKDLIKHLIQDEDTYERSVESFVDFDEVYGSNLAKIELIKDFFLGSYDVDYHQVFINNRTFLLAHDIEACIKYLDVLSQDLYNKISRINSSAWKEEVTAVYHSYEEDVKPKAIDKLRKSSKSSNFIILEFDDRTMSDWFELEERGSEFITVYDESNLHEGLDLLVEWVYRNEQ